MSVQVFILYKFWRILGTFSGYITKLPQGFPTVPLTQWHDIGTPIAQDTRTTEDTRTRDKGWKFGRLVWKEPVLRAGYDPHLELTLWLGFLPKLYGVQTQTHHTFFRLFEYIILSSITYNITIFLPSIPIIDKCLFLCQVFTFCLFLIIKNDLDQFYRQDIELYILVHTFVPIHVYVLQNLCLLPSYVWSLHMTIEAGIASDCVCNHQKRT